jgi:hypothetical protein
MIQTKYFCDFCAKKLDYKMDFFEVSFHYNEYQYKRRNGWVYRIYNICEECEKKILELRVVKEKEFLDL